MSVQGTNDFVDAAVDSLRQGNHPFVLVVLHDFDEHGECKWNLRCGHSSQRDLRVLRAVVAKQVDGYLSEQQGA